MSATSRRMSCAVSRRRSAYPPGGANAGMTDIRITIAAIPTIATSTCLVTPIFNTVRPKKPGARSNGLLGRNSLALSSPNHLSVPRGSLSSSNLNH
jgi:hypothetical protein